MVRNSQLEGTNWTICLLFTDQQYGTFQQNKSQFNLSNVYQYLFPKAKEKGRWKWFWEIIYLKPEFVYFPDFDMTLHYRYIKPGADLGGGGLGARPTDPLFWGPNFCCRRNSAVRCQQKSWLPPPPYTNPGSATENWPRSFIIDATNYFSFHF